MKLAFYAPLKPANHPNPSGDRAMARALMAALADSGHSVTVASELRSFEPVGDATAQSVLIEKSKQEIARLIALGRREGWAAWLTYHNYYKAPDLIGPHVCAALGIPYLLVEATRARKRLGGPWDKFARASEAACDAADAIFYLTARDAVALHNANSTQRLVHLHPFVDRTDLPAPSDHSGAMLSVAMMRKGDKLASYKLIAQTLALLPPDLRRLHIIGDGAARGKIKTLMAPFEPHVTFHGALDADGVAQAYSRAKLLFWPGVNEAFGLTYLEAQAAGVPVIAQDRPGVCDVTCGPQPDVDAGPRAMADKILRLMGDADLHRRAAMDARAFVQNNHLRSAASHVLNDTLRAVSKGMA